VQSPAARAAARRGRGVPVPAHADPAQRLTGGPPRGAAGRVARREVTDLRCWRRAELELPAGLVVVCGPNGAGKTSLVEAVVLATLGVSPRTAQLSELVRHGCPALRVGA